MGAQAELAQADGGAAAIPALATKADHQRQKGR